MTERNLYHRLSNESELPIAVYSDRVVIAVHGWLPAKPQVAPHEALPSSLNDRIKRADGFGEPVQVGGISWQPALYKGIEMYRAGLLAQRAGIDILTNIVVKIPPRRRPPKIPSKPDPSAAIKFVRKNRLLPGDLDDPPVPTPQLVWFDPSVVLGEEGAVQLAWRFSFTGDRPADVIVSLDGTKALAVIATEPESPYTYATTPRYLLDPITGVPRFVSFVPPLLLPQAATGNPIAVAETFFQRFPAMFGTGEPSQHLGIKQIELDIDKGQHVVLQQIYAGLLVWGCELRVHLNDKLAITSISGRYYRDPDIDLTPKMSEQAAFSLAMTAWMRANGGDQLGDGQTIERRGLVVFPWRLANPSGWNSLAWWFRFPDADRFVSAHTGRLIVAISRRHSVRKIYDLNGQRDGAPAELQLEDGVQRTANPLDPEALTADGAIAATEGFWRTLGRNSWDGGGADSIAHLDVNFDDPTTPLVVEVNAFWNGSRTVFSRNLADPDIVGHEFTHAVTEKTAGLVYLFESGAINESFSDVFGKLIFPTPQPWTIGAGNIARDLQNPAATPPPNGPCADNYATNYQFRAEDNDSGGVHFNSGIGNRAAVLIADGDGTVAHSGLGRERLTRIWWDTLTTRLSPWSGYIDLVANAWHVTRELADGGRLGVRLPGSIALPPTFNQMDQNEVLWAFRQVGLDLQLLSGWFRVINNKITEFVFFEGLNTPANEEVSDVIVRITQRRTSAGTRFLMTLQISTGNTAGSFGGVVTALITQHGVNSQSREVRVSVTALNFSDVDVAAQVITRQITPTPIAPPPTLPYVTPYVAHWFDNPFFLGRRYGDIVYEATNLPPNCTVSDVELELINSNGTVLARTRFGQPAAIEGGRGAWIFARTVGGTSIEVRVRSWHDFGTIVRYRLVYWVTADSCSLPSFTFSEVGPDNL